MRKEMTRRLDIMLGILQTHNARYRSLLVFPNQPIFVLKSDPANWMLYR